MGRRWLLNLVGFACTQMRAGAHVFADLPVQASQFLFHREKAHAHPYTTSICRRTEKSRAYRRELELELELETFLVQENEKRNCNK